MESIQSSGEVVEIDLSSGGCGDQSQNQYKVVKKCGVVEIIVISQWRSSGVEISCRINTK